MVKQKGREDDVDHEDPLEADAGYNEMLPFADRQAVLQGEMSPNNELASSEHYARNLDNHSTIKPNIEGMMANSYPDRNHIRHWVRRICRQPMGTFLLRSMTAPFGHEFSHNNFSSPNIRAYIPKAFMGK